MMLLLRILIFSINFLEKRKITPPKYTAITLNLTMYTTQHSNDCRGSAYVYHGIIQHKHKRSACIFCFS